MFTHIFSGQLHFGSQFWLPRRHRARTAQSHGADPFEAARDAQDSVFPRRGANLANPDNPG